MDKQTDRHTGPVECYLQMIAGSKVIATTYHYFAHHCADGRRFAYGERL